MKKKVINREKDKISLGLFSRKRRKNWRTREYRTHWWDGKNSLFIQRCDSSQSRYSRLISSARSIGN